MGESEPGAEWHDYTYSVLRYDSPGSRWEPVNIGIVLGDPDTGIIHRRLMTAGESMQRSAEALAPCPVVNALDPGECGTDGNNSGDPAGRLSALHEKYGAQSTDILRVTEPRALWLPSYDHEGAVAWCYETMVSHGRRGRRRTAATAPPSEDAGKDAPCAGGGAGGAGAGIADPHKNNYTFVVVQYVPDAVRNEPVNVGVIVADSASGKCIVRYAAGEDLERLGTGRFNGLDFALSYEREARVADADAYLKEIAEPDISSLHCTPPHKASGPGPRQVLDTLYDRIVAPAPHHDGARRHPRTTPDVSRRGGGGS